MTGEAGNIGERAGADRDKDAFRPVGLDEHVQHMGGIGDDLLVREHDLLEIKTRAAQGLCDRLALRGVGVAVSHHQELGILVLAAEFDELRDGIGADRDLHGAGGRHTLKSFLVITGKP